jgi:Family of unknown function (DUF5683)
MSFANQLNLSFEIGVKLFIALIFICCFSLNTKAQTDKVRRVHKYWSQDTVVLKPDTAKPEKEKIYHPDSTHDPFKTVIKSAIMPGWGQIYNRRWWKVPLIYGGLASFTVYMVYNHRNYEQTLIIYGYYKDPSKVKAGMPDYVYYKKYLKYGYIQSQVADAAAVYDRNFQLSILGLGGVYLIQLIDAYIDAKFAQSFTLDNNLGFKLSPGIMAQPMYAVNCNSFFVPSIKLTIDM